MTRVGTGSSLSIAENTLEATVVVPLTTVDQLLTGTPALQAVMAAAGFCRFVVDPFSRQLQPLSAATQTGSGHTSSGSTTSSRAGSP
jgi:hypothetical protein